MDEKAARAALAANLDALMNAPGRPPVSQAELARRVRRHGQTLSQSSINRILNAEVSCGLDHLAVLAAIFDLEPWQLLVRDFDPAEPPVLVSVSRKLDEFQATLKAQFDQLEMLRSQMQVKK
jgi:hypothetical protein